MQYFLDVNKQQSGRMKNSDDSKLFLNCLFIQQKTTKTQIKVSKEIFKNYFHCKSKKQKNSKIFKRKFFKIIFIVKVKNKK